jgi:hypothetical protein
MSVVAMKKVGTQGSTQWNRLGLSLGMLELIVAKRVTHLVRLSYPHFVATQTIFRLANKSVKAAISYDAQAYVKQ